MKFVLENGRVCDVDKFIKYSNRSHVLYKDKNRLVKKINKMISSSVMELVSQLSSGRIRRDDLDIAVKENLEDMKTLAEKLDWIDINFIAKEAQNLCSIYIKDRTNCPVNIAVENYYDNPIMECPRFNMDKYREYLSDKSISIQDFAFLEKKKLYTKEELHEYILEEYYRKNRDPRIVNLFLRGNDDDSFLELLIKETDSSFKKELISEGGHAFYEKSTIKLLKSMRDLSYEEKEKVYDDLLGVYTKENRFKRQTALFTFGQRVRHNIKKIGESIVEYRNAIIFVTLGGAAIAGGVLNITENVKKDNNQKDIATKVEMIIEDIKENNDRSDFILNQVTARENNGEYILSFQGVTFEKENGRLVSDNFEYSISKDQYDDINKFYKILSEQGREISLINNNYIQAFSQNKELYELHSRILKEIISTINDDYNIIISNKASLVCIENIKYNNIEK